jgi:hypothetical protein
MFADVPISLDRPEAHMLSSPRWFSRLHGAGLLGLSFLVASAAGPDDRLTLARGTAIDMVLVDPLSSRSARVGDAFAARLARDVYLDGRPVLAAGTAIEGEVESVESLRGGATSGYLGVRFVRIVLPSEQASSKMRATLSGMPQADAGDPFEPAVRLPVVLIAASPSSGRGGSLVLDASAAEDYSRTRLSGSDVDVAAGTELSMQLDQPLALPAHVLRAALRTEARRTRQTSGNDVAAIQRALEARRLYSGPIDGLLDDATRLGILRFQIQSNHPATGDLDAWTLSALGLRSAAHRK